MIYRLNFSHWSHPIDYTDAKAEVIRHILSLQHELSKQEVENASKCSKQSSS